MSLVCAFTGHRPQSLPFGFNESDSRCVALKQCLRDQIVMGIEEKGVSHFISGMAIGIDLFAAEIVLDLKSIYPYITLEGAIPCETQATKWKKPLQDRYHRTVSLCDKITLLQHPYTSDCMRKRNQYMVDQANMILAVWDGRPSGSGMTVCYARKQKKPVWIINPKTLEVDYGNDDSMALFCE